MPTTIDPGLLRMAVHDLRNALNALGITVHLIEGELPAAAGMLGDDVTALSTALCSMNRMVHVLGEYARVCDLGPVTRRVAVDTRTLLEEAAAHVRVEAAPRGPIPLAFEPGFPASIDTDPALATLAIEYALVNALAASESTLPRLVAAGSARGHLLVRVELDDPPLPGTEGGPISPTPPSRLIGSNRERIGLDLALAACISDRLGGSAHFELEPGRRSTILLDWPTHHPSS